MITSLDEALILVDELGLKKSEEILVIEELHGDINGSCEKLKALEYFRQAISVRKREI
jgi:hypothetical protein